MIRHITLTELNEIKNRSNHEFHNHEYENVFLFHSGMGLLNQRAYKLCKDCGEMNQISITDELHNEIRYILKQMNKETFESLWEYCTSNNRVCPMPMKWNELYQVLHDTKQIGAGYEPSIPLILGAWGNTSDNEKQERLKIHIKWAEDHNQLDEIGNYLRAIKEEGWAHFGEI